MPDITSEQRAALASGRLVRRDFVYVNARDAEIGDPINVGFWNDVGVVTFDDKDYIGAANVGTIEIAGAQPFTIPSMQIVVSGLNENVNNLVRGTDIAQAPITMSIGLFDPDTRQLIGPLIPMFDGRIDDVELVTPPAGEKGQIVFTCESASRALTIRRTDVRSNASQKQRDDTDTFFLNADAAAETKIYFGQKAPRAEKKD